MKKRQIFQLMVASSALVAMIACGGQGKTEPAAENDSTVVEETQVVVEEPAVPVDVVKGELGMFELRGPVKTCKVKANGNTFENKFNEDGFITVMYGQPLKEMFKTIKRDKEGRMQHCSYDGYDETFCNYKVNDDGLIVETEDWPYMDGGCKIKYAYDENGDLTQMTVTELGMDAEGTTVTKYTIEERDAHGNWTRRKANGKTETRVITYYE